MTAAAELALADVSIVVPTIGRPSLARLLDSLAEAFGHGPTPAEVVLVDDRPTGAALEVPLSVKGSPVRVLRAGGRGPAAARNRGWRATRTPWVAFLDDDVLVSPSWSADLASDLAALPSSVGGSQGRVEVPLPAGRRPTDWERGTAGLATSRWITADCAYRREVLEQVGGFDERFRRAYREDADLALRAMRVGWGLVVGGRLTAHPVRPADRWVSVRLQAGNADDVLMRRLHGRGWREAAGAPKGLRSRHFAVTGALVTAVAASLSRRPRLAMAGAAGWAWGTGSFAWRRIAPGPRTRAEVLTILATSAAIPPAAVRHTVRGLLRHRTVAAWSRLPDAVLFDRDGTLVHDVPYNGDPDLVQPVAGAREALDRLRAAGVPVGVVSNQSGVSRGLLTRDQVDAVNARVEQLLGPFATWQVCPHGPGDGCACRKPAPGMVLAASGALDVAPQRVVVVGDIGADVEAADNAGAAGILVPTEVTRPEEVAAARWRVSSLPEAVEAILRGAW